jgi:hypothetical protein
MTESILEKLPLCAGEAFLFRLSLAGVVNAFTFNFSPSTAAPFLFLRSIVSNDSSRYFCLFVRALNSERSHSCSYANYAMHNELPNRTASPTISCPPLCFLIPSKSRVSPFKMNTYKKSFRKPFRMNTYKSLDLKSLCFQHLQKIGGGGLLWLTKATHTAPRGSRSPTTLAYRCVSGPTGVPSHWFDQPVHSLGGLLWQPQLP